MTIEKKVSLRWKQDPSKPVIYLAGKITKNDWRQELGINPEIDSWPSLSSEPPADYPDFLYSGPFSVGCDHGCWHGQGSHGAGAKPKEVGCSVGVSNDQRQRAIYLACLKQIARSHAVLAHISTPDCYGTLTEIARAAEQGKLIALHLSANLPNRVYDDLWFIREHANIILRENLARAFHGFVQYARMFRTSRPHAVIHRRSR